MMSETLHRSFFSPQHECILDFLDQSKSSPSIGETGKKETSSSLKWDKTEGTVLKKDVHFEI